MRVKHTASGPLVCQTPLSHPRARTSRVQYKLVEGAKLEEAKQQFESVTCHVYSIHAAPPSSGEAMWSLNHQQDRDLYAKVTALAA